MTRARAHLAGSLAAFEVMWPAFYEHALASGGLRAPLAHGHAAYVLVESMGADTARDAAHFSEFVESAMADGVLADGNLHLFVTVPERPFPEVAIDTLVYDCVGDWDGSISAEHGIGLLKRPFLDRSRSMTEIEAMRRIKRALDPNGIMNPGKVI